MEKRQSIKAIFANGLLFCLLALLLFFGFSLYLAFRSEPESGKMVDGQMENPLHLVTDSQSSTILGFANHKWSFTGVMVPFYNHGIQSASLRIEKGYVGRQRRGFLRIGVLPMGILEGVTLEIGDADRAAESLTQFHDWISPRDPETLELRRVRLGALGVKNFLESAVLRVGSDGQFKLFDADLVCGTNHIHAARGVLQATGEHTGELVLQMTPSTTITNNFLPLLSATQTLVKR